jgi:large-conductance mechanosensitive channel
MSSPNSNQSNNKDTGIALTLLLAIYGFFSTREPILLPIISVLILTATLPVIFFYPGKIWFSFSELLGTIMSKIILTVVFFLVVAPIGLFRRLLKADPLQLKLWKNNDASVFRQRRRQIIPKNLEPPY